ncbi:MAG: hypothetical protein ACRDT6_27075 [Micromonosporaceae bacterium]
MSADPPERPGETSAAVEAYHRHLPSMVTHRCVTCDQQWPCRPYRTALAWLRTAGDPRHRQDR